MIYNNMMIKDRIITIKSQNIKLQFIILKE